MEGFSMQETTTIPFSYRNKTYSLEQIMLYLVRREINTYGKQLRGILYTYCPTSMYQYAQNNQVSSWAPKEKEITKEKSLAKEIQNIYEQFYLNKFTLEQKNNIYHRLRQGNKVYRIYDFFDLPSMYSYYQLLKDMVEKFNERKIGYLDIRNQKQQEATLYDLYQDIKKECLQESKEKMPFSKLHTNLDQTPIVANKESQLKINAMYEYLGTQYNPLLLNIIVDTYLKTKDIQAIRKAIKVYYIMHPDTQMIDNTTYTKTSSNENPVYYDQNECLGEGEPYYEYDAHGKKHFVGYLTSDGQFFPDPQDSR